MTSVADIANTNTVKPLVYADTEIANLDWFSYLKWAVDENSQSTEVLDLLPANCNFIFSIKVFLSELWSLEATSFHFWHCFSFPSKYLVNSVKWIAFPAYLFLCKLDFCGCIIWKWYFRFFIILLCRYSFSKPPPSPPKKSGGLFDLFKSSLWIMHKSSWGNFRIIDTSNCTICATWLVIHVCVNCQKFERSYYQKLKI